MHLSQEQTRRLTEQLEESAGVAILHAIESSEVEDLVLNPNGLLWEKTRSSGWENVGQLEEDSAYRLIQTVAAMRRKTINDDRPVLETIFPLGDHRFEA